MTRLLLKPGQIVTEDPARAVIAGGGILVEGNDIVGVVDRHTLPPPGGFPGEVLDLPSRTAIPGFIQTHLHLCQTLFRGLADDMDLLDWLKLRIFPLEAAQSAAPMNASTLLGITELIRSGTTAIMDMGSVRGEEEIVHAIDEAQVRRAARVELDQLLRRCKA